jgi:hypothetical protein
MKTMTEPIVSPQRHAKAASVAMTSDHADCDFGAAVYSERYSKIPGGQNGTRTLFIKDKRKRSALCKAHFEEPPVCQAWRE